MLVLLQRSGAAPCAVMIAEKVPDSSLAHGG